MNEQMNVIPLGIYRHYKGNEYEVIGFARHSETLEDIAIYKALYNDGGTWVRPLSMWENPIEVDGVTVKRFEYVGESNKSNDQSELSEAIRAISSLTSKCEKAYTKLAEGTSQHTMMKNRLEALKISSELIKEKIEG